MVLLEASTSKHKTSMTKETKTVLLPYTCLGRFIGNVDWADSFMTARSDSGLQAQALFLPSWNEVAQTWPSCPMSSGEVTCWIRELLAMSEVDNYNSFSSHSAKCTLLTWAGMTTIFSREERTLLGHHVEPQTRSATIYNRDSQMLLQYKVSKLISMIRDGKLKPDASRAARLSMMLGEDDSGNRETSEKGEDLDLGTSDEESEDADLEDESSPVGELDNYFGQDREPVPEHSDDFLLYMHCFTGVVHAADISSREDRLLCGRALTVNLVNINVGSAEAKTGLMCMQCSSVMNREAPLDEDSEWERIADSPEAEL